MTDQSSEGARNQTRLFAFIFAALVALLGAGYFLFLRTDYVVLYSDLRNTEAAAIVTELDRRGVNYRLGQGGASILVPADEADGLRIGLAGTDLPTNGEVGFEVFNESSMGLTDFAQKINYQRALQGELSRTIMSMEGVESARVHLALPERALFRGARGEPRAAVTVIPKRGQLLDEPRVVGIQRLVAASVPDLQLANVIVLDGFGRIISPAAADVAAAATPELEAARQQYQARIRAAVTGAVPALPFQLELELVPSAGPEPALPPGAVREAYRPFNLRILILTPSAVAPDDQAKIIAAVRTAAALDESAGDSLSFRTASLTPVPASAPAAAPVVIAANPATPAAAGGGFLSFIEDYWVSLLALIGIAAVLIVGRLRTNAAWKADRDDYVRRIRAQLTAGSATHG